MSDSESIDASDLDDDFDENNKKACIHKPLLYILPIWHPYCKFKIIWSFFVVLILLFTSIQIPYFLAFDLSVNIETGMGIVVLIMDILLCIDILITFRTAFYDEYDPLLLITCPVAIASQYVKFWFWFDLITSFPFDLIIGANSAGYHHYAKILRLIRVIRIFRIVKVLRILSFSNAGARYSPALIYKFTICKIIFAMAFISHLFACLWWAVGTWMIDTYDITWVTKEGLDDDNISNGIKYSTSMYWSVITLFTTGYGDITATNVTEQWVAIFCVCAGSCVSAWFIGAFSAIVLEGNNIQHTQREAVCRAHSFCNQFQFDEELQRAILSHTKYYYHYNYLTSSNEQVMNCLPLHLQNYIRQKLATRSLKQIDLFKHLSDDVLGNLVLKIKSVACNAGYCLYKKGEIASELYICRKGKSILIADKQVQQNANIKNDTDDKELDLRIVRPGHVIGEYCLSESNRLNTLKCLEWSEFMVITKDEIINCINDYYNKKDANKILNGVKGIITKLKSKRKRRRVKLTNGEKMEFERADSFVNPKGIIHDDSNAKINVRLTSFSMSDDAVVNIERRKLKRVDKKLNVYDEAKNVELTFMNKNNGRENSMDLLDDEWSCVSGNNEQKLQGNVDVKSKKLKGKKKSFFKMNFFKNMGKKSEDVGEKKINQKLQDIKGKNKIDVHSYEKTGQQSEFDESDSNDINFDGVSDPNDEQSNEKT
eukprot:210621_1